MSTKVSTDLINLSGNTGGLVWAKGTTAQQPASATAGEMRVDTTTHTTLVYNGTEWKTLKETAFIAPPVPTHFLVIAGGGGGGYSGGGGGAGGFRTSYGSNSGGGGSAEANTSISLNTAYDITVGAGGGGSNSSAVGSSGTNSTFDSITSAGGGGGGSYPSTVGGVGGSGGGGASSGNSVSGGVGTANQGYTGGNNTAASPGYGGGGGGGAFSVGVNGTSTSGGNGGAGITSSITGSNVNYSGGGGAGVQDQSNNPPTATFGIGGSSVGGDGQNNGAITAEGGVFNTGSGGGGGGQSQNGTGNWIIGTGGSGSPGAVILRYPTADLPYFTTTGTLNTPSTADTVADTAYPVANTIYYKLDSNANDSSGNSYNGTATDVTFVNGRFNQAGAFNGSSSKITAPAIFSSSYTGSVSISVWFNTSNTDGNLRTIFVTDETVGSISGKVLLLTVRNSKLELTGYNFPTFTVYGSTIISDGNWHNIVMVVDNPGGTIKGYLDGNTGTPELTRTITAGQTLSKVFTEPWTIGSQGTIRFFDGDLDQVRIFSLALAPGDVEDLYNEHFPTKFTDGSNTALKFTDGTGDITFSDTAPVFTPGDNFNTVLYTGNGGTQAISTVGFQPDLVWIKQRTLTESHSLFDTVRGVDLFLRSDTIAAENNFGGTYGVNSFNSNGFTVGNGSAVNGNGYSMVAWSWKAGGAARNNTDGTITSNVSANTAAGFSIISYTGNSTAGATVGHGLNAIPEMVIVKTLNSSNNWAVYNKTIGNTKRLSLDETNAEASSRIEWNNTTPTSSIITFGNYSAVNTNQNYIAYCFHSVVGYSKIGSYTGNGSTTGPIVTTGFESAWIMVKRTDNTSAWNIQDNKRNTTNPRTSVLQASSSDIEYTSSSYAIDFNATGFQIVNSDNGWNTSGGTYIYMTFAAT